MPRQKSYVSRLGSNIEKDIRDYIYTRADDYSDAVAGAVDDVKQAREVIPFLENEFNTFPQMVKEAAEKRLKKPEMDRTKIVVLATDVYERHNRGEQKDGKIVREAEKLLRKMSDVSRDWYIEKNKEVRKFADAPFISDPFIKDLAAASYPGVDAFLGSMAGEHARGVLAVLEPEDRKKYLRALRKMPEVRLKKFEKYFAGLDETAGNTTKNANSGKNKEGTVMADKTGNATGLHFVEALTEEQKAKIAGIFEKIKSSDKYKAWNKAWKEAENGMKNIGSKEDADKAKALSDKATALLYGKDRPLLGHKAGLHDDFLEMLKKDKELSAALMNPDGEGKLTEYPYLNYAFSNEMLYSDGKKNGEAFAEEFEKQRRQFNQYHGFSENASENADNSKPQNMTDNNGKQDKKEDNTMNEGNANPDNTAPAAFELTDKQKKRAAELGVSLDGIGSIEAYNDAIKAAEKAENSTRDDDVPSTDAAKKEDSEKKDEKQNKEAGKSEDAGDDKDAKSKQPDLKVDSSEKNQPQPQNTDYAWVEAKIRDYEEKHGKEAGFSCTELNDKHEYPDGFTATFSDEKDAKGNIQKGGTIHYADKDNVTVSPESGLKVYEALVTEKDNAGRAVNFGPNLSEEQKQALLTACLVHDNPVTGNLPQLTPENVAAMRKMLEGRDEDLKKFDEKIKAMQPQQKTEEKAQQVAEGKSGQQNDDDMVAQLKEALLVRYMVIAMTENKDKLPKEDKELLDKLEGKKFQSGGKEVSAEEFIANTRTNVSNFMALKVGIKKQFTEEIRKPEAERAKSFSEGYASAVKKLGTARDDNKERQTAPVSRGRGGRED